MTPLPAQPSASDIIRCVAVVNGVAPAAITGPSRFRRVVHARQLAALLMRATIPRASLPWIGARLKRDHTTALFGIRKAATRLWPDLAERDASRLPSLNSDHYAALRDAVSRYAKVNAHDIA